MLAIPIYEAAAPNVTEGGGVDGNAVVLLDVASATPSIAQLPAAPQRFRPHGAAWTPGGGLLVTAQLLNQVRPRKRANPPPRAGRCALKCSRAVLAH